MNILTISGSSRAESNNTRLLYALQDLALPHTFTYFDIHGLPLFRPENDKAPYGDKVLSWRNAVKNADGLIISTPEYIYNIPAAIKNALEWLTSSGELSHKKTIAISCMPNAPRGEKALQSLLWSLNALEANVLVSQGIYTNEIDWSTSPPIGDGIYMLNEMIGLLN